MKFLNLDHLDGPGRSIGENFELLNLELIKADLPNSEVFRIAAPDGGIDIYCRSLKGGWNQAIQCKAYPRFRTDLVTAVAESARAAVRSAQDYPWDRYVLIIPFVPTIGQRSKLKAVLPQGKSEYYIIDGDELEATLFRHPGVARRFFPNLIIVTPTEDGRLSLGYPDDTARLQIKLRIRSWKQTIPVTISPDAKAGSLLQVLIGQLSLPVKASVLAVGTSWHDIIWELIHENEGCVLDLDQTLRDQGVLTGATVGLRYKISIIDSAQFMRDEPETPYVSLESFFGHQQYPLPTGVDRIDDIVQQCLDAHLRSRELV